MQNLKNSLVDSSSFTEYGQKSKRELNEFLLQNDESFTHVNQSKLKPQITQMKAEIAYGLGPAIKEIMRHNVDLKNKMPV